MKNVIIVLLLEHGRYVRIPIFGNRLVLLWGHWLKMIEIVAVLRVHYSLYISGSQPFPTSGPLDKFCLGSRTTKKVLTFLGKISEFLLVIFRKFKFCLDSRTTKNNFANSLNLIAFFRVKA